MFWLTVAYAIPHHDLAVTLSPSDGRIEVIDRYQPEGDGPIDFELHAGLAPTVHTKGWSLIRTGASEGGAVPTEKWRLQSKKRKPPLPIELHYSGTLVHTLEEDGTPGLVSEEGVYLSGSSFWVPTTGAMFDFTMQVEAPEGWRAVSQGNPTETGWNCPYPMEEAYLVAAPFSHSRTVAETDHGPVGIEVFLRAPDPELASRYQAATAEYLSLYEGMLPDYPYESFALVENFWETGYGMPGFTLLGPKVIRFPWVLTSSYPHELLHNWWGNSVYIDPAGGNWAEGLTAYMADHLFAEQRGQDAAYRRSTLQKYSDIAADQDFALVEFQGRTSAETESIGYGKALMFWHGLRNRVGEKAFLEGLSAFYLAKKFQPVGFMDLEPFLSEADGNDLKPIFDPWIGRPGAVRLGVEGVEATEDGVRFTLKQLQEVPFPAAIPVVVTVEGRAVAEELWVDMTEAEQVVEMKLSGRGLRLDVDPRFDVMRHLDPLEVPPAITTIWGEATPTFVLPEKNREAWMDFAKALAGREEAVFLDDTLETLPPGAWVLGSGNRFGPEVAKRIAHAGVALGKAGLSFGGKSYDPAHAVVLVARSTDPARANAWVAARPEAMAGLARKVPHYGKYSLLAFEGDEPTNVVKATWPSARSPLAFDLTAEGLVEAAPGPARVPLAGVR